MGGKSLKDVKLKEPGTERIKRHSNDQANRRMEI